MSTSPAAFAPLVEVRSLSSTGRVIAVTGIDPRFVGQAVKEFRGDVCEKRGKSIRVSLGVSEPAREQAIPGEQVRRAIRVVVQQGNGSGRVANQLDRCELYASKFDDVTIAHGNIGGDRNISRIIDTGCGTRTGGVDNLGEGLPVIRMGMRGHNEI